MELSGCDAAIVRADADLDLVVKALKFSLALNDGATCMAPKRVFRLPRARRNWKVAWRKPCAHHDHAAVESGAEDSFDDLLAHGAHFIAGGLVGDQSDAAARRLVAFRRSIQISFCAKMCLLPSTVSHRGRRPRNRVAHQRLSLCARRQHFHRDEAVARELAGRVNAGVVTINDLFCRRRTRGCRSADAIAAVFGSTRGAEGLLELTVPKVVTVSRAVSFRVRAAASGRRSAVSILPHRHASARIPHAAQSRGQVFRRIFSGAANLNLRKIYYENSAERTNRRHRRRARRIGAVCTLAARGYAVTLFERNAWLGGKAAQLEGAGFRFDMGRPS